MDDSALTSMVPLASSTLVAAPHTPSMVAPRVSVVPSPHHYSSPPTSREEGGGEEDGGVLVQPGTAEKQSGSTDKTSGGDKDTLEEDRIGEEDGQVPEIEEAEEDQVEVEEAEEDQVESLDGQVENDDSYVKEGTKYTKEDMSLTLGEHAGGGEEVEGGTEHSEEAKDATEVRGASGSGWETLSQEDVSAGHEGEEDTERESRKSPGVKDVIETERRESEDGSKLESSVNKSKEREEAEVEYAPDETPEQDMNMQNLFQESLDLENDTGPVHNSTPIPEEGDEAESTLARASGNAAEKAVLGKTRKSRRSTKEGSRGKRRRREGSGPAEPGASGGAGEVERRVVRTWLDMVESGLLPQKFEPKWPPIFFP